jgi:hypothetical protein
MKVRAQENRLSLFLGDPVIRTIISIRIFWPCEIPIE